MRRRRDRKPLPEEERLRRKRERDAVKNAKRAAERKLERYEKYVFAPTRPSHFPYIGLYEF